ncbi:hypothetical protein HYW29_01110 [Candidatus Amesbacteria bacterium]|nr:hypothetical protein [Candidatus Amesbacteria bacterium]
MPVRDDILIKLGKKYKSGGYALVSPSSGRVAAYGKDIKLLYQKIDRDKINDSDKMVMYIPSSHHVHIFHLSVSVRSHR